MNLSQLAKDLWPFLRADVASLAAGGALAAGGGSGGSGGELSEHTLSGAYHTGTLANSQGPQFLLLDGTRAMTGNLNMGGYLIDGVNLSAHVGDPDAHHARQHGLDSSDHTGTLSWAKVSKTGASLADLPTRLYNDLQTRTHSITGADHSLTAAQYSVVGATATNTLGVLASTPDGAANHNTLLRSSNTGGVALDYVTTPLIDTASGDLVLSPAAAVKVPNAKTVRSSTFDSSFPIQGWQINEVTSGLSALIIGRIAADELSVKVFVADETRVDRGDQFWTKSYGIVAETFTTPGSIGGTVTVTFEDSPALSGAIFSNNDWILFRIIDDSSGLDVVNVWGQVSAYASIGDDRQTWTFTLRSGPTGETIRRGMMAIDFGASGAALIHLSVIDPAGAPYLKLRRWAGANPYTPANYTTYVQIGDLGSIGNSLYTPVGDGLYIRATASEGQFIVADDNGLQIRGAALRMYNGANQTVGLDNADGSLKLGTNIASDATTSFAFNGTTGDTVLRGTVSAAGDVVRLDSTGARILMPATTWASQNALRFVDGSAVELGGLYGYTTSTTSHTIGVRAIGTATRRPAAYVLAEGTGSGAPGAGLVYLAASNAVGSKTANITLDAGTPSSSVVIGGADVVALSGVQNHVYTLLRPPTDLSADLGTASFRFGTLYVNQIIATSVSGATMDGQTWTYPGSMVIDAVSSGNTTVSITNSGAGQADLNVQRNIIVGGTVDGVDISVHNAATAAHGATGAVVGTTNTQTLSNKTLTTPTIANFTNAQHTHADAAGGGTISYANLTSRSHALVGADHTASGLTAGHVIRASGATTFAWAQLAHSDLSGIGTNTHTAIDTHIATGDIHVAHSGVTLTAGDGLTGGGTIAASRTFTLGTPSSLTATSTNTVTSTSHTHAIDATIARSAIQIIAGNGLSGGGDLTANRTLTVGPGTLITVEPTTVGLSVGTAQYQVISTGASPFTPAYTALSTFAGNGLSFTSGQFVVGQGAGLTVGATDVALTTPGSLSVSSSNSSTGNHTHAIATSSNPGVAASILASTAAGGLTLTTLALSGTSAGYALDVNGDVLLRYHLEAESADFNDAVNVYQGDFRIFGYDPELLPTLVPENTTPLFYADVSQMSIGINGDPDPQFSLKVYGAVNAEWFVGPHAIQLSDAVAIMHFDGPGPYNTNFTGTSQTHKGKVGTATGGVIYRPGKFGKAVQLAEATTNLVANPSFETGIGAWETFNGISAGTETDSVYGSQSLYVARNGAGDQFIVTNAMSVGSALTDRTFTVSFWWRAQTAGLVTQSKIALTDGGFGNQKTIVATGTPVPTTWTRRTATVTFTGTVSSTSLRLALRPSTTDGAKILYDAIQVEEKAYATPYHDGSLTNPHSWSGTAHASTSSRTAARINYPTPIPGDTGTVMGWVRFDRVRPSNPGSIEYEVFAECNYGAGGMFVGLQHNTSGTRHPVVYGLSTAFGLGPAWTPPPGQWVFIAVTWDGTTVTLYGGREDGNFTSATQAQSASRTFGTDNFTVGQWSGSGNLLNGLVDDLVILSRAADADEIRAIYESNAPVFAESSTSFFKSYGPTPVEINEEGLWVEGPTVGAIFGIYGASSTKSWGGVTLSEGDILIGRSPAYALWDDSEVKLKIGNVSNEHLSFDGSTIAFMNGANTLATLDGAEWIIGATATENVRISSTEVQFRNGSTVYTELLNDRLRIGQYANGKSRIEIDDTNGVRLIYRTGDADTVRVSLTHAGSASFTGSVTANSGSIAGVLSVGVSGEIRQGSGTIGSNFTGLRIWNDSGIGRIAGYNSASVNPQWYAGSDGKLYAGGGNAVLDSDGIKLNYGGASGAHLLIRNGSTTVFDLYSETVSSQANTWLKFYPHIGGAGANLRIAGYDEFGVQKSQLQFQDDGGLNWIGGTFVVNAGISLNGELDISATDKALRVSRLTTSQRDALSIARGQIIFNTTTKTAQVAAVSSVENNTEVWGNVAHAWTGQSTVANGAYYNTGYELSTGDGHYMILVSTPVTSNYGVYFALASSAGVQLFDAAYGGATVSTYSGRLIRVLNTTGASNEIRVSITRIR